MKLSREKLLILSILSYKPCKLHEVVASYLELNPRGKYSTYRVLSSTVSDMLRDLKREGYIITTGKYGEYVYNLSGKGIRMLIKDKLRKVIIL